MKVRNSFAGATQVGVLKNFDPKLFIILYLHLEEKKQEKSKKQSQS
jgi:hypothetical protein